MEKYAMREFRDVCIEENKRLIQTQLPIHPSVDVVTAYPRANVYGCGISSFGCERAQLFKSSEEILSSVRSLFDEEHLSLHGTNG
jgi:hypothetical protein